MSKIEWTQKTWNPVTGCSLISDGCRNCYARRMALRLQAMGQRKYRKGFEVDYHFIELATPLLWKKPKMIFVCSMGDLFHSLVPDDFIIEVFAVMSKASQHTFQVLTKRASVMTRLSPYLSWTPNIWAGVTVESNRHTYRIDELRNTGAAVKFLSIEPMLSSLPCIELTGIDWVIVGGESGPGARPINIEWVRDIRDQCQEQGVPFFFKQWGGVRKSENGRLLDGRIWNQYPVYPGKEV